MKWNFLVLSLFVSSMSLYGDENLNPLLVFSAVSTKESVEKIAQNFFKSSGIKILCSFAGSGTLARQIESGALPDVFISANSDWSDYLIQKKVADPKNAHPFLKNQLVWVTGKSNQPGSYPLEFKKESFPKWCIQGKLALGNPDFVPAGSYAKEFLTHLGWWDSLIPSMVFTQDVRSALTFVSREEALSGIVYDSDYVLAKNDLLLLGRIPNHLHPPILYHLLALTPRGRSLLLPYFFNPPSAAVFLQAGFTLVPLEIKPGT